VNLKADKSELRMMGWHRQRTDGGRQVTECVSLSFRLRLSPAAQSSSTQPRLRRWAIGTQHPSTSHRAAPRRYRHPRTSRSRWLCLCGLQRAASASTCSHCLVPVTTAPRRRLPAGHYGGRDATVGCRLIAASAPWSRLARAPAAVLPRCPDDGPSAPPRPYRIRSRPSGAVR